MALPNTIEIKFEAKGDEVLIKTIKSLDKATKSLIKAQSKLAGEGKKQVQSHNKNKSAITRVNTELALQGSNWKKAGISAKLYTSAVKGNSLALAKVRIATKKHIADLTRQKKGLLDTAHSTRILGGSLAVLRSKLLIASFTFAMVGATVGKLVKAYAKQEKAEKKLAQALKSTGHSAGITHKELLLMASGLQAVTTHGDEAIIEAQSLMLTFTNINKEVFPQALESILNVSDAMGQDLKQSTIQIGKALNDPIQGMSALRRIGIQLSETQKNQVKNFMAVNDVASAQKIIIKELDTQFGGMARAVRLTLAGSLIALSNSFGDLMEKMGEKLAPFITALAGSLESITTIMQSEGERQLAFLTKIGASEDTIRLARIRLLKEEAQERIDAISGIDIDINKTKQLTSVYLDNEQQLAFLRGELDKKREALSENSRALLLATKDSEGFNDAIALVNSTTEKATLVSGKHGFAIAEHATKVVGANTAIALSVVEGQKDVEMTQERIDAQIALNQALADYIRSLGLLPPLVATTTEALKAQIKVADIAKFAMSALGDALVPDANVGEAFKKFIISYLNLIQGVIIASGEMSKAIAWAFTPMGMVKSALALVALEIAKAGVRNVKFAEHGFDGFVDKPTLFMTGEGNKREHVSITPLESQNINGAKGSTTNVYIQGGIVQEDYVTNELLPAINKARALA
jgi:hypothetical protein